MRSFTLVFALTLLASCMGIIDAQNGSLPDHRPQYSDQCVMHPTKNQAAEWKLKMENYPIILELSEKNLFEEPFERFTEFLGCMESFVESDEGEGCENDAMKQVIKAIRQLDSDGNCGSCEEDQQKMVECRYNSFLVKLINQSDSEIFQFIDFEKKIDPEGKYQLKMNLTEAYDEIYYQNEIDYQDLNETQYDSFRNIEAYDEIYYQNEIDYQDLYETQNVINYEDYVEYQYVGIDT